MSLEELKVGKTPALLLFILLDFVFSVFFVVFLEKLFWSVLRRKNQKTVVVGARGVVLQGFNLKPLKQRTTSV